MRPRALWLILTLLAVALFVTLGAWQWGRGQHRLALERQFAAGADVPLPLGSQPLDALPRFAHLAVTGEYDTRRQFLLDNMINTGRPGYQVLTLVTLVDGRHLLVNRGWLPFGGYRDQLPDVAFATTGTQTLHGRLDQLPTAGLASGRAAPAQQGAWPRVTSFPRIAELAAALGVASPNGLESRVLLLDADQPFGYLRDWQPPGLPPQRHIAYAVQWWAFAALALILFVVLNRRKKT